LFDLCIERGMEIGVQKCDDGAGGVGSAVVMPGGRHWLALAEPLHQFVPVGLELAVSATSDDEDRHDNDDGEQVGPCDEEEGRHAAAPDWRASAMTGQIMEALTVPPVASSAFNASSGGQSLESRN